MGSLSEYQNTLARIVCKDGASFTGNCEWFPSDYGLVEFDHEAEILQIGDVVIFENEIQMIEIIRREVCIPVRDWPEAKEQIITWFQERGHITPAACRKSILDCLGNEDGLPQWYVVVRKHALIAGCGVVESNVRGCENLTPSVCAVSVDEEYRGQGIARFMLQSVCEDMSKLGFRTLYLLASQGDVPEGGEWKFHSMVQGGDTGPMQVYVHHDPE